MRYPRRKRYSTRYFRHLFLGAPTTQGTRGKKRLLFQLIISAIAGALQYTRLFTFPRPNCPPCAAPLFPYSMPPRRSPFVRPHSSRPAPIPAAHLPRRTQDASCTWPRITQDAKTPHPRRQDATHKTPRALAHPRRHTQDGRPILVRLEHVRRVFATWDFDDPNTPGQHHILDPQVTRVRELHFPQATAGYDTRGRGRVRVA